MGFGEFIGAGSATTKLLLHLNGNSNDSSGNGNNGSNSNIIYSQANGRFNSGAGFNGSTSQILLNKKVTPLGAKTIGFWIKDSDITNIQYIYDEAGWQPDLYGNSILYYPNSLFWSHSYGNSGSSNWNISIPKTLVFTGKWVNVFFTWDGTITTGMVKSYLNGNSINSTTALSVETHAISNNTVIGKTYSSAYHFNGCLDEFIVENRVWSALEIRKYYTNSLGRF